MQRPLRDQVVVITGASSGIGMVTAYRFAAAGARVVLAARNENDLADIAKQIQLRGGQAKVVPTDVSDYAQIEHLAQSAVAAFGRIDTWVNDAGVSTYGTVDLTDIDAMHRVIQTNLIGVINGSKVAIRYLRQAGGGTLINLGSVVSDAPVALQAAYVASKHGVKGFTDALRQELLREGAPIQVTLIKPAGIDTPFFDHARSYMGVRPRPTPPVYDPSVVADAILFAATHPRRELHAGGASAVMGWSAKLFPRATEALFGRAGQGFTTQQTDLPDRAGDSNLYHPMEGATRGRFGDEAFHSSLYTKYVDEYPVAQSIGALAAVAAVGGALWYLLSSHKQPHPQTRVLYNSRHEPVKKITRHPDAPRVRLKEPRVLKELHVRLPHEEIRQTLKSIARDLR